MKKTNIARYDLSKVYYLIGYQNAMQYGRQHIGINGVKEQLDYLEAEKRKYNERVTTLVNAERGREESYYRQYMKWAKAAKVLKIGEISLIVFSIFFLFFKRFLPMYKTGFMLFEALLTLTVLIIGPVGFVISLIVKKILEVRYKKYIGPLSEQIDSIGKDFQRISRNVYQAIDDLYLSSLDPAHRETVIMRREQEAHNREVEKHNREMERMERERQRLERKRLAEQQRSTAATEELLAIEKERERRINRW